MGWLKVREWPILETLATSIQRMPNLAKQSPGQYVHRLWQCYLPSVKEYCVTNLVFVWCSVPEFWSQKHVVMPKKFIMTSKTRHYIQNMLKVCHDVKHIMTSKCSSWHQNHVKKFLTHRHDINTFVMTKTCHDIKNTSWCMSKSLSWHVNDFKIMLMTPNKLVMKSKTRHNTQKIVLSKNVSCWQNVYHDVKKHFMMLKSLS